jgi:hypothetical protein
VALAVYTATLYRTLPGGDSGELIAAAAATGVPHPPGYPLFVLLTKPFLWLPIGEVAARANFSSALAAAMAAALIAWGVARATDRPFAGLAAALVFAFSPTAWLYAIGAEVFSLNNLIIAAELALLVAVDRAAAGTPGERRRRDRLVYAAALVFGLGLSHHHTSLFLNGVFLAAVAWRVREDQAWRGWRKWAIAAAWVGAGGLPYLYLPIAASMNPAISWGAAGSVDGFLTHVLRREYGTFAANVNMAAGGMSLFIQLGFYARDLVHQVAWPGIALAVWGLAQAGRDRTTRGLAVATACAWALYLLVMHSLADLRLDEPLLHGVFARFWIAPNLIVCVWIGWGLARVQLPAPVLAAVAVVVALAHAAVNFRANNHRADSIAADYGASVLRSAPPGALVLIRGDLNTNTARYLFFVNHQRPDVRLLDMEMLTFRWMRPQVQRHMPEIVVPGTHYGVTGGGAYTLRHLIDANITTRPVVVCGGVKPGDSSLEGVYRLLPVGLCDRVWPQGQPVDNDAWLSWIDAARPRFRNDLRTVTPPDSWEHVALSEAWNARHRVALVLLNFGIELRDNPVLLRAAAEEFARLADDRADPPSAVYKNLGIARARLVAVDRASAPLAVAAFQTYLRTGPADDRDRPAIEQAVLDLLKLK